MEQINHDQLERLKFPIGRFQMPQQTLSSENKERVKIIAELPTKLRSALDGLKDQEYDTPYRPDGWSVRQLVHHIADSHINAFTRFKLGMTEDTPTIRPYNQDEWCSMADAKELDPNISLNLIEGVHKRWSYFLGKMSDSVLNALFFILK